MKFLCLNKKNIITNIIICDNKEMAKEFNAVEYYNGAEIGEIYNPPKKPTELDALKSQITYTALHTHTLINNGGNK